MRDIKATPEVKAQVIDWYQRKAELGSQPQLAAKLGLSPAYVERIIADWKWAQRP